MTNLDIVGNKNVLVLTFYQKWYSQKSCLSNLIVAETELTVALRILTNCTQENVSFDYEKRAVKKIVISWFNIQTTRAKGI